MAAQPRLSRAARPDRRLWFLGGRRRLGQVPADAARRRRRTVAALPAAGADERESRRVRRQSRADVGRGRDAATLVRRSDALAGAGPDQPRGRPLLPVRRSGGGARLYRGAAQYRQGAAGALTRHAQLQPEHADFETEMGAGDRRGEIQNLRRDVALIHADVAVIALDLLAGLGRGGAGVGEHDADRFAGEPPGLLHHAPATELVLDIDRRAGLGPMPALPHIFVTGGTQNAFGGVGERPRLAPGALKIGV